MTRHCNGKSGTHVEDGRQLDCAGYVLVDTSIQVWRPVAGTNTPPRYGFSLTPGGSPYLAQFGSRTPHQGVSLNLGGIHYLTQSGLSI